MNTLSSNLQSLDAPSVLKNYLAKECEGIENFVVTFEKRRDFVSLLKNVISSESVTISDKAYERLQLAIQKNRKNKPLLMTQLSHLKFLTSYLIKFLVEISINEGSFRKLFLEMLKREEKQFGIVYFRQGYPTGHYIAVYFERKNENIYAFISDGEACSFHTSEIVFHLEKTIEDAKLKKVLSLSCYSFSESQRRQNDHFSCSMFSLKDLSIFSKFSLVELLEKNEKPLPIKNQMVLDINEEEFPEVSYYLLDSLTDQFPSSYFKASQNAKILPKLKVEVEFKKFVPSGSYGSGSFSSSYQEFNFYTRYFNLKCLAKVVDEEV